MTRRNASLAAVALALAVAAPGLAADLLLQGGRVWTVSGEVIDGGSVLISEGKIAAVGADVAAPAGARAIDISGKSVCPGFVDTHSHLGLPEAELDETVTPISTDTLLLDAFWSEREDVRRAAASGVTTLLLSTGASNPLSGGCSAVKLGGRPALKERAAIKVGLLDSALWPDRKPTSMPGLLEMVAERLAAAREGADGDLVVHAFCEGITEVERAVGLAQRLDLRMSVMTGALPEELAAVLEGAGVSMIIPPVGLTPEEKYLKVAGELSRRGVRVGFASMAPATDTHDLRTSAAMAVGAGMDSAAALRALTLDAAAMIGVADRAGSIEVGKDGDVVVTAGDPLDVSAPVELVVIDGEIIYEREAT